MAELMSGGFGVVVVLFLFLLALLWFLLPFAIFGFQPKIEKTYSKINEIDEKLDKISLVLNEIEASCRIERSRICDKCKAVVTLSVKEYLMDKFICPKCQNEHSS